MVLLIRKKHLLTGLLCAGLCTGAVLWTQDTGAPTAAPCRTAAWPRAA